jgi:NTE family protein
MATVHELPQRSAGPRTVFVLGGGGNLGAVQVGMLRALADRGILPDVVIGCSVGALNGSALAFDPTAAGVRRLETLWLELGGTDVCPSGRLSGPWQILWRGRSMHGNHGLRRLVERFLPVRTFEELAVPFECVATSLDTGSDRWFSKGPLIEPVLASAALPAVFPPVTINGERLIDGAVVDNVPISRAVALGAERIYVLHVGNFDRPRPEPKRPIDVLLQAFSIARSYRFHLDMRSLPEGVEATVMPAIEPPKLHYSDFGRSRELIERGYAASAAMLDATGTAVSG